MKTNFSFKRILPLGIFLAMMLAVSISCKKKDSTPDPTPVPPGPIPTPLASPDVFQRKPLKMMSDYEIAKSQTFPMYQPRLFGKIMIGKDDPVVPASLKYIGQTLKKIQNYQTTQHQFQEVNRAYNQLIQQDTILRQTIINMGAVLAIDITQCTSMITTGDLSTQITNINSVWNAGASNQGFMWYSVVAANWESDTNNTGYKAQMQSAQSSDSAFCTNIKGTATTPGGMINCINQISADICPPDGTGTNALGVYAKLVISEITQNGSVTTSSQAMSAYLLLESYFLTALNSQTQAAIIYVNALNWLDPTGILGYDTTFWNYTYIPAIKPEVAMFLQAVNYLYINLADYRTTARFQSDMAYENAGLAPETIWIDALARAQLVANMIYDGLGLSYPVMCGTIVTPWNYTNGNSPVTNQITLQFNAGQTKSVTLSANTLPSQIPYTYWTQGSRATVASDYSWNVYQMGTLGVEDPGWNTGSLQITDGGSNESPWRHVSAIKGNVSVLYYNPQNPLDSSSTSSSTYCMPFAYFMANWQWGYMYCSDFQGNWWDHQVFYLIAYNTQIDINLSTLPTTPFTGTTNNLGEYYNHPGTFSYPTNSLGTMLLGGNLVTTDYFYMAGDLINTNVQIASDPSSLTNNQVQAWSYYKAYYDMAGSGGNNIWVDIGVGINQYGSVQYGQGYISDGSQISVAFQDVEGNWNSGVGRTGSLSRNTLYQPSIQYYYQTHTCGSSPANNLQLYTGFQFVNTGLYNLPPNP